MKIFISLWIIFGAGSAQAAQPCGEPGASWTSPPAPGIHRGVTDKGQACSLEIRYGANSGAVEALYLLEGAPPTGYELQCYLDKDTDEVIFQPATKQIALYQTGFAPDRHPLVLFVRGQGACRFR